MRALFLALTLAAAPAPRSGGSGVFLTVDEALALAFPECRVERATEYLTPAEEARVEELARSELAGRVVRPYRAWRGTTLVGTAYFDAHRVRTKNEVLMLVVAPDERLARVEVLSFAEPIEYLPKGNFYAQFHGQRLAEERERDTLHLDRAIRRVAGATLSAEAATAAARRTLALHRVLARRGPPAVATR